jgi:hypothetical protein
MKDEGIVAPALRGHVWREPRIRVGLRVLIPLLVEAEGRIGDYHVEPHQVVALYSGRGVECVAPVDSRAILLVQQHVEAG